MKNMYKYALLFALAGGAALFTGCRADEGNVPSYTTKNTFF